MDATPGRKCKKPVKNVQMETVEDNASEESQPVEIRGIIQRRVSSWRK